MKELSDERVFEIVSKCDLFENLDREILKSFLFNPNSECLKRYGKGDQIIKEGAQGNCFFGC